MENPLEKISDLFFDLINAIENRLHNNIEKSKDFSIILFVIFKIIQFSLYFLIAGIYVAFLIAGLAIFMICFFGVDKYLEISITIFCSVLILVSIGNDIYKSKDKDEKGSKNIIDEILIKILNRGKYIIMFIIVYHYLIKLKNLIY